MSKFSEFISKTQAFGIVRAMLQGISLPGFRGHSVYEVLKTLLENIKVHKLNVRGAAVTYNFFMAIPPLMLFFCSLIPYFPLKGAEQSILTILKIITPNEHSYNSFRAIVVDFLNHERRDILSFGLLSTFFFSSNGIMGLMRSFDRSQELYVKRNGLKRRWTAIKLTAMLLFVAALTLAALIIQTAYINELIQTWIGHVVLIKVLTVLIIVLMIFLVICMIYTYGPSLAQKFPFLSIGAFMATLSCVLLTVVFFALVKNVFHYNKIYGSIGTLMAFMVWLFLNTQVILLGFELNLSILVSGHKTRNAALLQKNLLKG